ncbi:MAG TPA: NAD(P)-dependent oxidoreductase [Thermoanaerobaculia bacterium]|jgi:D-3-phosphoglycerate dehydrogenase|nr:NAD(P)-dependent oxidoreductase [Thermoanaerobaculia bacterium]
MTKRVVITADVEPVLLSLLAGDARFEVVQRRGDDLAPLVGDADILITRTFNHVPRRVLEAAPRLKIIGQGTSGVDNIDLAAARERGIEVISLPGVNATAVAELVLGLMIALTRTVPCYDREVRAGGWRRGDCATRHELRAYRLGIIGLGNVGSRVARLARAFGMEPRAYDPYVEGSVPSLHELLATSDLLTLHVPLTPETNRMIGAEQLATLPRGAFLINASRGEVLDADAALAALQSNHLGGLALDVFDPEPPQRSWPDDARLILTPHIAGCTSEAKNAAGQLLYEALTKKM